MAKGRGIIVNTRWDPLAKASYRLGWLPFFVLWDLLAPTKNNRLPNHQLRIKEEEWLSFVITRTCALDTTVSSSIIYKDNKTSLIY